MFEDLENDFNEMLETKPENEIYPDLERIYQRVIEARKCKNLLEESIMSSKWTLSKLEIDLINCLEEKGLKSAKLDNGDQVIIQNRIYVGVKDDQKAIEYLETKGYSNYEVKTMVKYSGWRVVIEGLQAQGEELPDNIFTPYECKKLAIKKEKKCSTL